MAYASPFDPFEQQFTFVLGDGNQLNVTIPDLDEFVLYNVQICINYAAQLGGSFILLVVLLLLTKADKRRSPIFIINSMSLVINVIRNVLQCLFYTGPLSETFAYFSQDYSKVPGSAYATSVAATVLTFLLLVCVEISLILQVHVVSVTLKKNYRRAIMMTSYLIATMAIGFRLALCAENSRYIVSLGDITRLNWLKSAANITTSISICWFSGVFIIKLALALNERRKLGLAYFGPMQIIFIMGCQTLVIPALCSILQYFASIPAMSSNVLTLVTIFLPLSSLWASTSVRNQLSPSPLNDKVKATSRGRLVNGHTSMGSTGPLISHPILIDDTGVQSLSTIEEKRASVSTAQSPGIGGEELFYRDLEKQGLGGET